MEPVTTGPFKWSKNMPRMHTLTTSANRDIRSLGSFGSIRLVCWVSFKRLSAIFSMAVCDFSRANWWVKWRSRQPVKSLCSMLLSASAFLRCICSSATLSHVTYRCHHLPTEKAEKWLSDVFQNILLFLAKIMSKCSPINICTHPSTQLPQKLAMTLGWPIMR